MCNNGYKYKVNGKTVCGGEGYLDGYDRISLYPACLKCPMLDKKGTARTSELGGFDAKTKQ